MMRVDESAGWTVAGKVGRLEESWVALLVADWAVDWAVKWDLLWDRKMAMQMAVE